MKKNYTFKIFKNSNVIGRLSTHSVRRFLNHLRTINFSQGIEKVYLRVSYGKSPDDFGKESMGFSDGYFENKEDLLQAFKAFDEIGR